MTRLSAISVYLLLVFQSELSGNDQENESFLREFRSFERTLLATHTAIGHLKSPVDFRDSGQGQLTHLVKSHVTGENRFQSTEFVSADPPVYRKQTEGGNRIGLVHDGLGRMVVCRSVREFAFRTLDACEQKSQFRGVLVSSDSTFKSETDGETQYARYRVDSQDPFFRGDQMLWACGRGIAQFLDRIELLEIVGTRTHIVANGRDLGGHVLGRWDLTLDMPGYVVREARFYKGTNPAEWRVRVQTTGLLPDGTSASAGILTFGRPKSAGGKGLNLVVAATLQALNSIEDTEPLVREVTTQFAEISREPTRTEVDYRCETYVPTRRWKAGVEDVPLHGYGTFQDEE